MLLALRLLSWGESSYAAATEPAVAVGRGRKRIVYEVTIDGETDYYATPEAAEQALRKVYKQAKNVARTTLRKAKHVPMPEPVKPPAIVADVAVEQYVAMLAKLYEQIETNRVQLLAEMDDEDDLLMLL